MRPDIAFLHTSPVHAPAFTALLDKLAPGLIAAHVVDEALLCDAREMGHDNPEIVNRVQRAMRAAADSGAPVVVCTCSTIGAAAEATPAEPHFIAMRIDRAMADAAASTGSDVLVVAALASTLKPTSDLVRNSASRLKRSVQVTELLVADAWSHFEQGNISDYSAAIARAVRNALPGPAVVVLAQASMAPAADLLQDLGIPVLSSPVLGIRAALAIACQGS